MPLFPPKPATYTPNVRNFDTKKRVYVLKIREDGIDGEPYAITDTGDAVYHHYPYATSSLDNLIKYAERNGLESHIERIKNWVAVYEEGAPSGTWDMAGAGDCGAGSCYLDKDHQFYITFLDD